MSIVLITGDHPRHRYLADRVMASGIPTVWIVEQREKFVPEPPAHLSANISRLFLKHFDLRDQCEQHFFGHVDNLANVSLQIQVEELNGERVKKLIQQTNPQLLLSYGCHKLSADILSCFDGMAWNVHGGLSPWYRGVATHFWPSYMLEPQMTGVTLHETTEAIDGGNIIHQTSVIPRSGDRLHDLACRSVQEFCDGLPELLVNLLGPALPINGIQPKTSGRIWTSSMWLPQHLDVIYGHYDDKVVDFCLASGITMSPPKLFSVLKD